MSQKSPMPGVNPLVLIRESLNLSQAKMAKRMGMKFTTYKNWEYREPPPELVDQARRLSAQGLSQLQSEPVGEIRILGAIGANLHGPDYEGDESLISVPIKFVGRGYTGVPVGAGEYSMHPYIQPGDTLIFKEGSRVGKFVAVRLDGDVLPVCKKLVVEDGQALLRSMNKTYPDIPADGHEILSFLVGIIPADDSLIVGPYEPGIDENYLKTLFGGRMP